jgi:hypothetical protein
MEQTGIRKWGSMGINGDETGGGGGGAKKNRVIAAIGSSGDLKTKEIDQNER